MVAPFGERKVRAPQGTEPVASQGGVIPWKVPQKRHSRWPEYLKAQAKVKRCGKSAPDSAVTLGLGKPLREQGQTVGRSDPLRYHLG